MELLSPEFLSALMAIVVIDLVLAGDNAIVIALAARRLPPHLQRRAIAWGTVGAIVVRTLMTLIVVWLLNIPGLLLAGGAMLIWIAYRLLLTEEEGNGAANINGADSFWGALRTVVVADMVMGLDNVLAVAGAAHGSYLLVVLGLLISVPIVIWGSSMLLRFVERFPAFVYLGAAVLAGTAAKMILSEPYLASLVALHESIVPLAYGAIILGVLWAGFARNHRRIAARISPRITQLASAARSPATFEGEPAMMKVLLPVDGSRNDRHALERVVAESVKGAGLELHVLNVQPPFSRHVARFSGKTDRDAYHREQADRALGPTLAVLEARGIPCHAHFQVGDRAAVIAETAKRLGCDHIVMSTARKNSLTRMLEDSVTNRVLELTSVPVEVVAGDAVSRWERYGIPAAVGTALSLVLIAD